MSGNQMCIELHGWVGMGYHIYVGEKLPILSHCTDVMGLNSSHVIVLQDLLHVCPRDIKHFFEPPVRTD